MKAWFLHPIDEWWGYVVHAETRSKAKAIGMRHCDLFGLDPSEWNFLVAHREKRMDDKPITVQSLVDEGWDMQDEDGKELKHLDLKCPCDICKDKK